MTETPLLFGPDASLVGVLTQPDTGSASKVAFLTFNAGVIPRLGPHRLNVKIARTLASAGETSLRFDLSGQGDSRSAVGTEGDFWAQAVRDLRSAMDHLERHFGIRHFALIGICSGAVNVFAAARADARVVGAMMFDGHWYGTRWSRPVRHWKRFRNSSWAALASTAMRRLTGLVAPKAATPHGEAVPGASGPANPPRDEFVRAVQALADRGVALYFMYSGSAIEYYSYAGQFRDAFGREAFFDKVRCDFRPDLDHTLISLAAQQRMIEVVSGWVPEVQRASASQA
jgi:hypothetical protein